MTVEEERWIEIILEEGRKAEPRDRPLPRGDSGSSRRDRIPARDGGGPVTSRPAIFGRPLPR